MIAMEDCDFSHIRDRRSEGKTPLEQARLVELYILDVFDEICKKNGLRYWINYGTLLGACRHGGFIPWDDDIDVSMPLSDYRRFLKIAPKVLPNTIRLQDIAKMPNARFMFAKLRDTRSFYYEDTTDARLPSGIFIDIFPAVRAPRLPPRLLNFICWVQYTTCRHAGDALGRLRRFAVCKMLDCVEALFYRTLMYCSIFLYDVATMMLPSGNWRPNMISPSTVVLSGVDIFPLTRISFEGREYSAPNNVNAVLDKMYGNWRQLPPPEKRQWHAKIIVADVHDGL